ncbi:MAG: Phosphoglucomutase [candidate division WS2 bacterium]|nr:Phosphoglucomutase [Candidatus Lithacetigena glycinireducens]
MALDGDADRFGIISHKGRFITPNEVFTILAYHLGKRGQAGIGRTVSTTRMLNVIAQHHQVSLFGTPVGFKYLGALIRDGQIYLGGEESGGLPIKGWVPEKDGILAVLLVLGLCAEKNSPPAFLIDDLYNKFGKFYNQRVDIKFSETTIFGLKIKEISRKDGLLITFGDLSWCLLRQSGTENMIRFYYESCDKTVFENFERSTLPFLV